MATSATALLADFDFDLTLDTQATPLVPRPPTPDPRRTPTPHPPRRSKSRPVIDDSRKRIRKKPTAIFIGSAPESQANPNLNEPLEVCHPSYHTLPSLLPLLPSTPLPHFATSPSLSSSGSTLQSSPTLTPTTVHFGSSFNEPQPHTKSVGTFSASNPNQGKSGLRRAKRLPHRDQGQWEVHAVVHVGEDLDTGRGCGSSRGKLGHWQVQKEVPSAHYDWCMQQQKQAGFLVTSLPKEPVISNSAINNLLSAENNSTDHKAAAPSDIKLQGFHGVRSESASREGGLRSTRDLPSSSLSLSKYHFPAPPGDYRIGLSGDLQHPAKIHYRGASFDLVNPHASLLLSSSQFQPPAEIDGLLDDYFEDPDAMPRPLYSNPATARRDIMGLERAGEAARDANSSHETSTTSLVPTRPPSDPFDLRITDVPSQAAQTAHHSAGGGSTLVDIVEGYDYTREVPFEHEETLRALESGVTNSHSEEVFQQLPEDVQQHMSAELSNMASDMPTSDRTYGDTGQLLGLTPQPLPILGYLPTTMPHDGSEARIRPAPGRSTTATTVTESGLRSVEASLHGAASLSGSPESRSTQIARGGSEIPTDYRDVSYNSLRSDGEGDWETTRSESRVELYPGQPRPSQDSYANTSTYNEDYRLSAMSDATIAGKQSTHPYRTTHSLMPTANGEDVTRARHALERIYRDKVHSMIGSEVGSPQGRRKDRGILQGLRDRRQSAILEAHENDIELEEIRQNNPQAVRLAAEQMFPDTIPERVKHQPTTTPLDRLRGIFSRNRLNAEQIANRDIMNETMAEEDDRILLAPTPVTIASSRFAFSESANTFRTFRDVESPPASPIEDNGRAGLDFGERPLSPAFPAAAYTPDRGRVRHIPRIPDQRYRNRDKAPKRPVRRAAMSSQTSLRNLITSGSPTSNIQGAFTDREMAEASKRWNPFPPQRHDWYRRGKNASGPYPTFPESPLHHSTVPRNMLMHPGEVMNPSTELLQERLSKMYLMRILACPPLCFLYYSGHYDHLIAKKTDGKVLTMSPARKEDALAYGILISIVYVLIVVGITVAVALIKVTR